MAGWMKIVLKKVMKKVAKKAASKAASKVGGSKNIQDVPMGDSGSTLKVDGGTFGKASSSTSPHSETSSSSSSSNVSSSNSGLMKDKGLVERVAEKLKKRKKKDTL